MLLVHITYSCTSYYYRECLDAGAHHWICSSRAPGGSACVMDSKALPSTPITANTELQLAKIYNPFPSRSSLRVAIASVQQQEGLPTVVSLLLGSLEEHDYISYVTQYKGVLAVKVDNISTPVAFTGTATAPLLDSLPRARVNP